MFMAFWVSMGIYGCPWVSMSTYRCFWVFPCLWVFIGVMGVYGWHECLQVLHLNIKTIAYFLI